VNSRSLCKNESGEILSQGGTMPIDLYNLLTSDMKLDPQLFSEQVIVVTGAGRGIGFQTARAFALLGGKVVLAELSDEGIAAEKAIQKEGCTALYIQTDVSSLDSVNQLLDDVHQVFGSVDVLVNNAIFIHQNRVVDLSLDIWDRIMGVNLRGTFLTCRAFLPKMLERNHGVIINMISTDAMPGLSAYIASKNGITGFSQSLALELDGTNIQVVPFGPGMVDTPGIRSVADGLAPQLGLTEEQFLNLSLHAEYEGLMPPEHAAAATVYLTAHLAHEFHGQVVNGYEVLERAGVLKTKEIPKPDQNFSDRQNHVDSQILFKELSRILVETEAEFNQLPVFVRPMAKNGFKSKSGMSLSDWQRLVSSQLSDESSIPENYSERLEALANYYREVPKETARFTKDEATLKMVTETAHKRVETIQDLASMIQREHQWPDSARHTEGYRFQKAVL
jgi:NAD(P)-dependent dehydrogenase (short-subunit alcohol dehydrogenase family)